MRFPVGSITMLSSTIFLSAMLAVAQSHAGAGAPPPASPPAATSSSAAAPAAPPVATPANGGATPQATGSSMPPEANTGTPTNTTATPAQTGAVNSGSPVPPADNQGPVNTPTPTNATTVTGGGFYGASAGPRLVTTPEVNMSQPNPSVGATNATTGNQAGASNSTLTPTATMPQVPAAYANQNLGMGGGSSAWEVGNSGESLAEASMQARMHKSKDHPRVFTNDDIARLRNNGNLPAGASNGVINAPVTNQNTMPASDVTVPSGETVPAAGNQPQMAPPKVEPQQKANQKKPSPFTPKQQSQ